MINTDDVQLHVELLEKKFFRWRKMNSHSPSCTKKIFKLHRSDLKARNKRKANDRMIMNRRGNT